MAMCMRKLIKQSVFFDSNKIEHQAPSFVPHNDRVMSLKIAYQYVEQEQ